MARIGCSYWLDEQKMRFLLRHRAMFDPFGDDAQLTRTKGYITLAHADGDAALENDEELVRVVVRMPDELTLDLDNHEIMTIELADDPWLPVTFEGSELRREIDGRHETQGTWGNK